MGAGSGPSVGGQRPRNNNFTVEGADNNRKDVTGPAISVPNDAVAEFTVLQNQFSAEFGHSSGAQFNTVLRSGGNQLHGGGYEYLQIEVSTHSIRGSPAWGSGRIRVTTTTAWAEAWVDQSRRTSSSSTASTNTIR